MISIMLHIQTNQSLREAIDNGQTPRGTLGDPQVLEVEEKGNVGKAAEKKSRRGKLTTTTDNLEHLSLDFPLKLGIKLVTGENKKENM